MRPLLPFLLSPNSLSKHFGGLANRYAYQPSFILKPLVTAITLAYFLLHDDLIPLPLAAETIGSRSPNPTQGRIRH